MLAEKAEGRRRGTPLSEQSMQSRPAPPGRTEATRKRFSPRAQVAEGRGRRAGRRARPPRLAGAARRSRRRASPSPPRRSATCDSQRAQQRAQAGRGARGGRGSGHRSKRGSGREGARRATHAPRAASEPEVSLHRCLDRKTWTYVDLQGPDRPSRCRTRALKAPFMPQASSRCQG